MLQIPAGVKVLQTDPLKVQQAKLYSLQDSFFPKAEKLVAEALDMERQRVVAAVRGAVSPAACLSLADEQLKHSEELAASLVLIYQDIKTPVGELYFPRGRKALPPNWWENFMKALVASRVVRISRTTRDAIRDIIHVALDEGLAVPKITKLIDNLYLDQIIPNRARTIARTEVISASNAASYASAKETGVVTQKIWLAASDSRTRDSHASANGQTVGIDDYFIVGSSRMLFPGDGSDAEEVVNCRCSIGYRT